jgi:pyridoxal biosynthesis lyase PdxS
VLGRVLGVRILTLRATVVLAPASVTTPADGDSDRPGRVDGRRSRAAPNRRRAGGRELAEAVRRIDEGAELLAEARRRAV